MAAALLPSTAPTRFSRPHVNVRRRNAPKMTSRRPGGLVIGILQSLSTAFISSVYGDAVTFAVLFGLLVIWPAGIFPSLIELQQEEI